MWYCARVVDFAVVLAVVLLAGLSAARVDAAVDSEREDGTVVGAGGVQAGFAAAGFATESVDVVITGGFLLLLRESIGAWVTVDEQLANVTASAMGTSN